MEFFYEDRPRLTLWFDSPNHCATVLSIAAIVSIGFLTHYIQAQDRLPRAAVSVAFIAASTSIVSLAFTYSRGGWVSFFLAVAMLSLSIRNKRFVPASFALVFLVILSLIPKGSSRANSMFIAEDESVSNRLVVWKGALAMTGDHWMSGVGRNQFGEQFTAWYQPEHMRTRYLAALNNYLTLSAEQGIFALGLYLWILLLPACLTWHVLSRTKNAVMKSVVCSLLAYGVSSFFTFNFGFWHVDLCFSVLVVWCIVYAVRHYIRIRTARAGMVVVAMILSGGVAVSLFAFWGLSRAFSLRNPISVENVKLQSNGRVMDATCVHLRDTAPRALAVYLPSINHSVPADARTVLRPLAQNGFLVVSTNITNNGLPGLDFIRSFLLTSMHALNQRGNPVFIIGHNGGGRLGIIAAAHTEDRFPISGVCAIACGMEWPLSDLAPINFTGDLAAPLLLIYDGTSSDFQVQEGIVAKQKRDTSHLQTHIIVNDQSVFPSRTQTDQIISHFNIWPVPNGVQISPL